MIFTRPIGRKRPCREHTANPRKPTFQDSFKPSTDREEAPGKIKIKFDRFGKWRAGTPRDRNRPTLKSNDRLELLSESVASVDRNASRPGRK